MFEFDAIGTHWWIEPLDTGVVSRGAQKAIREYTVQFERRYSRFHNDSLVAQLARNGTLNDAPEEFFVMLTTAKDLYEATEGTLTPLVGNVLQRIGYGNIRRKPAQFVEPAASDFMRDVRWGDGCIAVPKGLMLDFGGFGKGWLIDAYAELLERHGVLHYIVNGGGDLRVSAPQPTQIYLEHPYDASLQVGEVSIQQGALGASSTVKRSWMHADSRKHHIIDPRTNQPSDSKVVASFVLASTALIADALATVLIIRPDLKQQLEYLFHVQAIVLREDQFSQ